MKENDDEIDLKSLAGKHRLSGVDLSTESVKEEYGSGFEDCQCINFRLGHTTYRVIEDPSDGYRSSMRSIRQTKHKITNRFSPIEVLAIHRTTSRYNDADILEFYDTKNGQLVLEVGTDNSDDYYPSFVGSFHPENMHTNAK